MRVPTRTDEYGGLGPSNGAVFDRSRVPRVRIRDGSAEMAALSPEERTRALPA
jgi:hypothetical protein